MKYWFTPYVRRAAAAAITGADQDGRAIATVTLQAAVTEQGGGVPRKHDHSQTLTVYGPGDAKGIDPAQVVRMSPHKGDFNAEPNYLAAVEFAHPDLPWLFSPVAPVLGKQLTPWLALVVVLDEDPERPPRVQARPGSPNPVLEATADELPDWAGLWAWAHTQVIALDEGAVAGVIAAPERQRAAVRSRLLSPRRLLPNHAYSACVVPTFETGRRVGLGLGLGVGGGTAPAWAAGAGPVQLPVYHQWRFGTGMAGDFETLARKLRPVDRAGLKSIGKRRVLIDPIASRMQSPTEPALFEPLVIEVATAITTTPPDPGPLSPVGAAAGAADALRDVVNERLKRVLDQPERQRAAGQVKPAVGPPIYGQWHAETRTVDADPGSAAIPPRATTPPPWIPELNLDPDTRSVAGVGTHVVQREQEALMAAAWDQLEAVVTANRRARWGQLFLHASKLMHERRLQPRSIGALLQITSPALARLRVDEVTVAAKVEASPMPPGALSATMIRSARFATRFDGHVRTPIATVMNAVAAPMMAGTMHAGPDRFAAPPQRLSPAEIGDLLREAGAADRIRDITGLTIDEHVSGLTRLPEVVRKADARQRVAEGVPIQRRPVRPSRWHGDIELEFGSGAQAVRVHKAIKLMAALGAGGGLAIAPDVLAELATISAEPLVAPGRSLYLSQAVVRVLNEGIGRGDLVDLAPINLADQNVRMVVNPAAVGVLDNLQQVGAIDRTTFTAVVRQSELWGAAMAPFQLDAGVVPTALVDVEPARLARAVELVEVVGTFAAPPERVVPPPLQPLAAATVRDAVLLQLEPDIQFIRMLDWFAKLNPGPRRRSPSHPILAAPKFPEPFVDRVTPIDRDWVLGGSSALPPNSICLLSDNRRFVESILAGANHEMARELLWRGYPTDQMGTCFARFWPTVPPAAGAPPPDDVAELARWGDDVGDNPATELITDTTMIVIRGELLRRYPTTIVSAVFGTIRDGGADPEFVRDPGTPAATELFRGRLPEDITYVALGISPQQLHARDGEKAWFVALTQPSEEPRFGLDEELPGSAGQGTPDDVNDLSWQRFAAAQLLVGNHLSVASNPPAGVWPPVLGEWGPNGHGGAVAAALVQLPFQLLLRAIDYLPEDE